MEQKQPLIILTGPTAVGKTALSVELAKKIDGEIISADSMQVYRFMDIGSAKIKQDEMRNVRHHLIDVLMPEEEFNVFRFQEMAKTAIREIYERGHIPILTGGTGFYIQAILYDIVFNEENGASEIRVRLEEEAKRFGNLALFEKLKSLDPESAEIIHPNNTKRLIRALEYYEINGSKISEHNRIERERQSPYKFCYFVLNDDREKLYDRIEKRVDEMLVEGLLEEVKKLKQMGYHKDMISMQGLGYKEILSYLEGEYSLEEAVYLIKRDTRHFAKRQLTWFRRENNVIWINKKEFDYDNQKILDYMENYYKQILD